MGTIASSSSNQIHIKTMSKRNNCVSSSTTTYVRRAHHAGSWYSDDREELDATLTEYLAEAATAEASSEPSSASNNTAPPPPLAPLRAILCPHAGYSYSGPTAAYSYQALRQEFLPTTTRKNTVTAATAAAVSSPIRTILVLHPSHHYYHEDCALSGASVLETPLGNLVVDEDIRQELLQSFPKHFSVMRQSVDEAEHSGELQYPYIAKAISMDDDANTNLNTNIASSTCTTTVKVLPIMCGNLSLPKEKLYGELLAEIISRPTVLCVISTDFCHWGRRFSYQPTSASQGSTIHSSSSTTTLPIHEFISQLDHQGMHHIQLQQPGAFATYLQQTRNTICGRHAVQVWLHAVQYNHDHGKESVDIDFVKYDQSSPVTSLHDSSVSYASAVARTRRKPSTQQEL